MKHGIPQETDQGGAGTGLSECRMLDFPKVSDRRGNLTFLENSVHIPFDVRRVFYVYDIPSGESRGAHAHYKSRQVVICVSGGLDLVVEDGHEKRIVRLNRPNRGFYIPNLIWTYMQEFDPNTVYIVLSSTAYDEKDYIRDYGEYLGVVNGGRH